MRNILGRLHPKSLLNFDTWILKRAPILWSTRIHFVLFWSLILAFSLFLLGLLTPQSIESLCIDPVKPKIIHKDSILFIYLSVAILLWWGIIFSQTNRKQKTIIQSLFSFLYIFSGVLFILSVLIPANHFGKIISLSNRMGDDDLKSITTNNYFAYGFIYAQEDLRNIGKLNFEFLESNFHKLIQFEDTILTKRYSLNEIVRFDPNIALDSIKSPIRGKSKNSRNYTLDKIYCFDKVGMNLDFLQIIPLIKLRGSSSDSSNSIINYQIFRNNFQDTDSLYNSAIYIDDLRLIYPTTKFSKMLVYHLLKGKDKNERDFLPSRHNIEIIDKRPTNLDYSNLELKRNTSRFFQNTIYIINYGQYLLESLIAFDYFTLENFEEDFIDRKVPNLKNSKYLENTTRLHKMYFSHYSKKHLESYSEGSLKFYVEEYLPDSTVIKSKEISLFKKRDDLEILTRSIVHSKQYLNEWIILRNLKLMIPYAFIISIFIYLMSYLEISWTLLSIFVIGFIVYSLEFSKDIYGFELTNFNLKSFSNLMLLISLICPALFSYSWVQKAKFIKSYHLAISSLAIIIMYVTFHAFGMELFFLNAEPIPIHSFQFFSIIGIGVLCCVVIDTIYSLPEKQK